MNNHDKDVETARKDPPSIVVAATFTADPIERPLAFWMHRLDLDLRVVIAPYAQVMQQLLDPDSLFAKNAAGFNILLLRLHDWVRDRAAQDFDDNLHHLRGLATGAVTAIEALCSRSTTPLLLYFAPPPESVSGADLEVLVSTQQDMLQRLNAVEGVSCWDHSELERLYPGTRYEDAVADRIGHIPFTDEYFAALATLFARRVALVKRPQYKVIAIDCDNTLWQGICGEDGAAGVVLTPFHLKFQNMLVQQHDAGMLLCLCSKNNPADVDDVFKRHAGMPLRPEHLISSRVNWEPKSENLKSLAAELNLSLDSFILIDDSPLECEEVRTHCSSVLTLQAPQTAPEMEHFLNHVWAFDRLEVTENARRRTAQYRENRARDQAREGASTLEQFLATLELKVDAAPMESKHLPRVAELVQRTNQFNLTTVRRTGHEIETLCNGGDLRGLVVHVRDRFGDYGLVGAVLYRKARFSIDVDSFVLSCRALGRGVEHQIVTELARIARSEHRPNVVLRYRPTEKNTPAWKFLAGTFSQFVASRRADDQFATESVFTIPVEYAESMARKGLAAGAETPAIAPVVPAAPVRVSTPARVHQDTLRLSRLDDFLSELKAFSRGTRTTKTGAVRPSSQAEKVLAGIFAHVLGIEEVGVTDDFFELGGNSLQAVQVISRVASRLSRELSLQDFFEEPTVAALSEKLVGARESSIPVRIGDADGTAPLSWSQQRLWFIDRLEGGSSAYHLPVALHLSGTLNAEALQRALDSLVERHEALRTIFKEVEGAPTQQVLPPTAFELRTVDLRALPSNARESEVLQQSKEETSAPFALDTGPLIRGRLLLLTENSHLLVLTMHHIVSDGWSTRVLIKDLAALYEAHCAGRSALLPSLPIQYADYARWQRQWMTGDRLDHERDFWKEHLAGAPQLLELPLCRSRPSVQSYRGASVQVALSAELVEGLKALSQHHNVTPAMVLQAAWWIVLSRLSGQQDIVVGIPVANRRRTELESLIGFFVNTLPVRLRIVGNPTVPELLQLIRMTLLAAYAHQDVPFEEVVKAVQPARSLSHSPIFQTLLAIQPASSAVTKIPGLTLAEWEVPLNTAQFDLTLLLRESEEGISGSLNYATDLFDASTIERWAAYFCQILSDITQRPEARIGHLELMSPQERRQVIDLFNATKAPYSHEKLIHHLFEEQVQRTPQAIAVTHEGQTLTYRELNLRANQLAHRLIAKGVGPDQFVGICVRRTTDMIVGLLGILKAGGAYVPLDPSYPAERLAYILEDAAPRVLVAETSLANELPLTRTDVVALDTQWSEIARGPDTNPDACALGLSPSHLAYIIYTSGSTGKPKGVAIEHRNAANLILWASDSLDRKLLSRTLQSTALNFDLSVYECFVPLSLGASIDIVENALVLLKEPREITLINTVPSAMRAVVSNGALPESVRVVNLAGEVLKEELFDQICASGTVEQICNLYGPSETTTYSTWVQMSRHDSFDSSIGRPIANTQVYILDEQGRPVPIGVSGEIYIAGAGVARGYLNRPDLTAERFLKDPFSRDVQARMYRTGDLGRWRADGAIEYLGRNDHQVKLRGFRIELGEIEARLLRHPLVKEAVVLAREDVPGDKRLVAYVTSPTLETPNVDELREKLKSTLPEYMVPSAFVVLREFPLTPNGKLDRRALPAPDLSAYVRREFELPSGDVEISIADIWQAVLHVGRVGRADNFFELGGHSLLAAQLIARVQAAFGIDVSMKVLFEHPQLQEFAQHVEQLRRDKLVESVSLGGARLQELLESVASMPEWQARELLGQFAKEGML